MRNWNYNSTIGICGSKFRSVMFIGIILNVNNINSTTSIRSLNICNQNLTKLLRFRDMKRTDIMSNGLLKACNNSSNLVLQRKKLKLVFQTIDIS